MTELVTDEELPELIATVEEMQRLHEEFQDEWLDRAMGLTVKLMRKPDVPATYVEEVIVQLQAISTKYAFSKIRYKLLDAKEPESRRRKDLYYTAQDAVDKLVDALKYLSRKNNQGVRQHR